MKANKQHKGKLSSVKSYFNPIVAQSFRAQSRSIITSLIIFFSFGFLFAQNPIEMQVDTTNIRIGEQLTYKITVDKQENVLFPKLILDSLQKVELVKELKIDTTENKYIKKYILTSFDSGRYMIPKQKVLIKNKKYLIDSLFIDVATVKVDTLKQGLFPIKAVKKQPIIFDDYKNYLWIGLAILALLIFLLWYFVFRKKKEEVIVPSIPPYQLAVERLSVLDSKKLWQNNKVKQYYIELTDILRSYVENEYNIPALESTTDELIASINDFNKTSDINLPKETVKSLQKLLQEADLVKFAKFKPLQDEIATHRVTTENIINNLKPEDVEVIDTNDIDVSKISIEKPVKKKWSTKRIVITSIIAIAFLIISAIGYLGYRSYKFAKENIIGSSAIELLNGDWFTDTYGYPPVTIATPKMLKSQDVKIPEQLKGQISDIAVFGFENPMDEFKVIVSTFAYTNSQFEFSLEGIANGVVQEMEANGIEFLSIDKEPIFIRDNEGLKLTATYQKAEITTQKMYEYEVVIIAFGNKKGAQRIVINSLKNDENAQKIAERIINSIDIEDEVVE